MKVNEGTECGRRSLPRLGVDTPKQARWDRRALPSCAGAQAARLGHLAPEEWWSRRDRLLTAPPPLLTRELIVQGARAFHPSRR